MNAPYARLLATLLLGASAMFLVLRATLVGAGDAGLSLGTACIALMMAAPMGVLILLLMPHLFRSVGRNLALYAAFTMVFLGAYAATRSHALAGDEAALRASVTARLAHS